MGLLDGGLKSTFGAIFGPLFLDGTLYAGPTQVISNGRPTGAVTWAATSPVKLMIDSYSEAYASAAGIPDTDVKIIVLQAGAAASPDTDSQITARGVTYKVMNVSQDPAQAAWELRGRPV